ncbi:MAG: hypothetical protein AAF417_18310 [Pseudomonadota bacterium]
MTDTSDSLHFVGSIPLENAEQVFRELSAAVGSYASRLPDGETAERSRWIFFQREMLTNHPAMEVDPTVPEFELRQWDGAVIRSIPLLRFKDGVDTDQVEFETGYDLAAAHSFSVFSRLQSEGTIGEKTRFQVSLPTPMATAYFYVSPKARREYQQVYERSLLKALSSILDTVPAKQLTIQFDVCQEVLVFEDYFEQRPPDYKAEIFEMLGRLGDQVPTPVELGYHLCYGTPAQEHMIMPKDAAILVELLNGITDAVKRSVDYVHLPVPKHCTSDDYFTPFTAYRGPDSTKIYVGAIHHDDAEGDRKRIAIAANYIRNIGVATECGWGRADPATVSSLLESHRVAANALASFAD